LLFIHDQGKTGSIVEYITSFEHFPLQHSAEVTSIISLLHDAKKHCDTFPSTAVDAGMFLVFTTTPQLCDCLITGTAERDTIYLLTRLLNSMSGACEYSGNISILF
jgi:hypothetical protein